MMPLAILLVASATPYTSLCADEPPAAAATPTATSSPEAPPATPPTPVTPQPAPQPATPPTLAEQIDQLLPPDYQQLAAPETEPGLALRRLSLDLRGVVFRRAKNWMRLLLTHRRIDGISGLKSSWLIRCGDEHLVQFLDRTLMLATTVCSQVDRMGMDQLLREQVAADTPIDALVKQLLHAPWWNKDQRAVATILFRSRWRSSFDHARSWSSLSWSRYAMRPVP